MDKLTPAQPKDAEGRALPPLVGVSGCRRTYDTFPIHMVAEKYLAAVAGGSGVLPVIIPAFGDSYFDAAHLDALLERLDGLVLTGSPSNILPHHYGHEPIETRSMRDGPRDATTLPLIRGAVERGIPVFGICRGHQEMNVALGGTLHQLLHEVKGRRDHRSDKTVPHNRRYDLRHTVTVTPGGKLAQLIGRTQELRVNSLHAQAVDRPAPGTTIEAVAPDGTIEALSVDGAKSFALSVQWHPEWNYANDPVSLRLFAAFGDACRAYAAARQGLDAPAGGAFDRTAADAAE